MRLSRLLEIAPGSTASASRPVARLFHLEE
jgi:hypothetical protein